MQPYPEAQHAQLAPSYTSWSGCHCAHFKEPEGLNCMSSSSCEAGVQLASIGNSDVGMHSSKVDASMSVDVVLILQTNSSSKTSYLRCMRSTAMTASSAQKRPVVRWVISFAVQ